MKTITLLKIPAGLSEDEHRRASGRIVDERLDGLEVSCRGSAYGPVWDPEIECDLEFLRHYRRVPILGLDVKLRSLEPLSAIAGTLIDLSLSSPPGKNKAISLEPVANCPHLISFSSAWPGLDLAPLTRLHGLEELSLYRGTQDHVAILSALPNLISVDLGFGTVESLAGLEKLARVEYFNALRLRRLSDLRPLTNLHALRCVELDSIANVSSLPSLRYNERLHTVLCMTMNGLKDLDGLKGSAVRELAVINSRVPPEAIERISHDLPQLKRLVLGLRSQRDTAAAARHFDSAVLKESTNDFVDYYRDFIRAEYVALQ